MTFDQLILVIMLISTKRDHSLHDIKRMDTYKNITNAASTLSSRGQLRLVVKFTPDDVLVRQSFAWCSLTLFRDITAPTPSSSQFWYNFTESFFHSLKSPTSLDKTLYATNTWALTNSSVLKSYISLDYLHKEN